MATEAGQRPAMLDDGPVPARGMGGVGERAARPKPNSRRCAQCIARGTPVRRRALERARRRRLGLESSLRPRGRPRKPEKVECPLFHAEFLRRCIAAAAPQSKSVIEPGSGTVLAALSGGGVSTVP